MPKDTARNRRHRYLMQLSPGAIHLLEYRKQIQGPLLSARHWLSYYGLLA